MSSFKTIIDDFAFLEDWDDRYKYVIDLGRDLPAFPETARNDAHKVRGCASQVWLTHEKTVHDHQTTLTLFADSDAHIVRGLVAILLALYSGKSASEIVAIDAREALKPLDLSDHLTPQRSNGLASMIATIQTLARDEITRTAGGCSADRR